MFHQREIVRHRRARRRSSPGATRGATARSSSCAALGLDAEFDVATDPFFGRGGRMLAAQPARAGAEVRGPRPDRGRRADGGRLVQLPPRPFHGDLRDRAGRRRRRPHGVPRLRARADHARAVPRPTASTSAPGRTRSATRALAVDERRHDGAWSACSALDPATYRPHRLHARRADLPRDQLLHRRHHRAPPRPRRRAARGAGLRRSGSTSRATSGRSSSRDPRDLEPLFGVDIHEMQPYRPLPRPDRRAARGRPDDDRRARRAGTCPTRAATSYRTRARQDARSSPRRSTSRASRCATSTTASLYELERRRLPRRLPPRRRGSPPTSCRRTPSSSASTPVRA